MKTMKRELHHGHYLLPVHLLKWTPEQWRAAQLAMEADAQYTRDLCERGGERVATALGPLAQQLETLARLLASHIPHELRADGVRLLCTALRRAHRMDLAGQLVVMFNTQPGRIQP